MQGRTVKKKRVRFAEGDVFLVPLTQGGFAVGLIVRCDLRGHGVLAYIFNSTVDEAGELDIDHVVSKEMVVDVVDVAMRSLVSGAWPIVGRLPNWSRSDWPVPVFRYQIGQLSFRSQDDYRQEIFSNLIPKNEEIFRYVVYGDSALSFRLSRKFSEDERDRNWKVR